MKSELSEKNALHLSTWISERGQEIAQKAIEYCMQSSCAGMPSYVPDDDEVRAVLASKVSNAALADVLHTFHMINLCNDAKSAIDTHLIIKSMKKSQKVVY